jgi:hypothetical protein
MDEYIRADNDFRQRREEAYMFSEMNMGFGGRLYPRHVRSIHKSNANDERANNAQSTIIAHSLWACRRLLTDYKLREAGEEEASVEEDSAINPESCSAFSVVRTRVTQQGRARSQTKSKRKLLKLRRGRISRSKSSLHTASCYSPYIPEYVGNQ